MKLKSCYFYCRFFTAIWAIVRPWIDPVTREKFQILGSDYIDTLHKYIDDSQIPVELGGSHAGFKWSWPYPEESCCTPRHVSEYTEYLKRLNKPEDEKCSSLPPNKISEEIEILSSSLLISDGISVQQEISVVSAAATTADVLDSSEVFVSSTTVLISSNNDKDSMSNDC